MTTNKRNQDRTGQLSTHNIFYETVVAVTQFIQKWTSVASQNNTRQFKVKLFPIGNESVPKIIQNNVNKFIF